MIDRDGNGSVDEEEFVWALANNEDPNFLQWLRVTVLRAEGMWRSPCADVHRLSGNLLAPI